MYLILHEASSRLANAVHPSPSEPMPHPNAFWMGVVDPSGSPPIPHPNSLGWASSTESQSKVTPFLCGTSVSLRLSEEPKRRLIGPAYSDSCGGPMPTVAPVHVASGTPCSAASTGRGRSLLFCNTTFASGLDARAGRGATCFVVRAGRAIAMCTPPHVHGTR